MGRARLFSLISLLDIIIFKLTTMANEDYYHDQNAEALLVSYFVDSYRRDVGHLHQEYMRSILNDMIETQITASELIDKYELTVTDTTERALISASFELFKMWIDGES